MTLELHFLEFPGCSSEEAFRNGLAVTSDVYYHKLTHVGDIHHLHHDITPARERKPAYEKSNEELLIYFDM